MGKKREISVGFVIAVVFIVLVSASFAYAIVSHPASQVTAGTFGAGEFAFNGSLGIQNSTGSTIFYANSVSGNVGVGTASPLPGLSVARGKSQQINFLNKADVGATAGPGMGILSYNGTTIEPLFFYGSSFPIYGGNVGIGYAIDTVPPQPLSVIGNANITGSLIVAGNNAGLLAYPVGAIYMSVVSTSPATLFGGTWVAFATGSVLVGINVSDASFDVVEEKGGEKTTAAHTHGLTFSNAVGYGTVTQPNHPSVNADGSHTNLQPYVVVYMWKRTA